MAPDRRSPLTLGQKMQRQNQGVKCVTIGLLPGGGKTTGSRLGVSMSNLRIEEQHHRDVKLEDELAAAALMDVSRGVNCLLAASCLSSELTTDTTTAPASTQAAIWV